MSNQIQEAREIAKEWATNPGKYHPEKVIVGRALLQITEGDIVLVPREPTEERIKAGVEVGFTYIPKNPHDAAEKKVIAIYKAMISQQGEG